MNLKLIFPHYTQKQLAELTGFDLAMVCYYHHHETFMDLFNRFYKKVYSNNDYKILNRIDKKALESDAKTPALRLAAETHGLIKNETSVKIDLSVKHELENNLETGCNQFVNLIESMAGTGQKSPLSMAINETAGQDPDRAINIDYSIIDETEEKEKENPVKQARKKPESARKQETKKWKKAIKNMIP